MVEFQLLRRNILTVGLETNDYKPSITQFLKKGDLFLHSAVLIYKQHFLKEIMTFFYNYL